MHLITLSIFVALMSLSFGSSAETFKRQIEVAPKTKETVVVETDVPVTFNAALINPDLPKEMKCGNCLHIETTTFGSKNEAASAFGVGFIRVPPENGAISVDVYHDFDVTRAIQITADPYKGP